MSIGGLRHRVAIETISTAQDKYGQALGSALDLSTTEVFATVWGEVQDLTGGEGYSASEIHSQITTRIRIRFISGIAPSMLARVTMNNRVRVFDIMAVVDPDGRRRWFHLECKERVE